MTILLINNNPVVSRLLALCTRKETMVLEEVSNIDEASTSRYDVLFVDEASCEGDVASLSNKLDVGKKIYLSYSDEPSAGFDETIKKPFLPSQITDILKTVEVREPLSETLVEDTVLETSVDHEPIPQGEVPSIFPLSSEEVEEVQEVQEMQEEEINQEEDSSLEVLDRSEIEKIKALLDMEDEEPEPLDLDIEDYESRKIEVIKEHLISDGLEIFKEEEIADELSKENVKKKKTKKEKKKLKIKNKKKLTKDDKFTQEEWSAIKDAINGLNPKKIKKLLKGKEVEIKLDIKDNK
jgi:hypothetical protein